MPDKTNSNNQIQLSGMLSVVYGAAFAPAAILFALWIINTVTDFALPDYPIILYLAGSPLGVVPTFAVACANNILYGVPLLIFAKQFSRIDKVYWLPIFLIVGYFGGLTLYWLFTFPREFFSGYAYGLLGAISSATVWYLGVYRDKKKQIKTHNKALQSDAALPPRR